MVSTWRLLVAAVLVAAVLLLGLISALRIAVRRQRRKEPRWVWSEAILLGIAILVVVGGVSAFIEPYRPELVRVSVSSPKITRQKPIRLVQLSDLHSESQARLEERLPALIAQEHPDLIVFTGDAINTSAGLHTFRRLMQQLARIAPTFAVRGNWDIWWFHQADLFGKTGVRELTAEAVPIQVGEEELWIAGIPVDSEDLIQPTLNRVPPGRFTVLLHHFPVASSLAEAGTFDLHLAGDTHGGQLWLPGFGELLRISRHGNWESLGLHPLKRGGWLYVNRGIGMEGRVPPVRLFCRPEITVFEISPAP